MNDTPPQAPQNTQQPGGKHPIAVYLFLAVILASAAGAVFGTFTKELSCTELTKRTREWREPKLAAWSYMGSKDGYDHFAAQDRPEGVISTLISGNFKFYEVKQDQLRLERRFELSEDRSRWLGENWGPPGGAPDCL